MFKYNKLIPELLVSNLNTSLAFYVNLLGFKVEYSRTHPPFVFLSREGSQLMLEEFEAQQENWIAGKLEPPFGRGMNLQIEVRDVTNLYALLKKSKTNFFRELNESTYQVQQGSVTLRQFVILDPDGYLLRFAQIVK